MKEDLKKYEQALINAQGTLSREIKEVIRGAEKGSGAYDEDEETDEAEESGIVHAEQIVLKGRLHAVLDALLRIKAGTYGVCEKCGKPIETRVLDVAPESLYCVACK